MKKPAALQQLGNLSVSAFLEHYWQQRPVLLRNVFPDWTDPVTPANLLELATLDDADCRLILREDDAWQVTHGPFDPEDFEALPHSNWTVLVQEVDRLSMAAARLLESFRFLPNWRLDDLMVSYAAAEGGVGAHIDRYDVFLIQGSGSRRWEISDVPVIDPVWRADSEVAILEQFEPTHTWVLEPGDVLYLPPNIPHHGIALAPCITMSVGFRAPGTTDLLSAVAASSAESNDTGDRFTDPGRAATHDPGLLSAEALQALRARVRGALSDDAHLNTLIARALSEPTRGRFGEEPEESVTSDEVRIHFEQGGAMLPTAVSQVLWTEAPYALFAAGRAYSLDGAGPGLGAVLTGAMPVRVTDLAVFVANEAMWVLLAALVNDGAYRLV